MNDPTPGRWTGATPATGRTVPQLEYEAILGNVSIGIAFTRERRFSLCNPRFAEMFGWRREELVGQSGEVIYPSRDSFEALGRIAVPLLSAGSQLDVEWAMRRKDGSIFLCRVIAKAIDPANAQHGTVWIIDDITDRRRQSEELERLLREQEATLANATVGISFVKQRRIQRANPAFEAMFGFGTGEMVGLSTAIIYPDQQAFESAAREAYPDLVAGGGHPMELRLRRRDGALLWCRASGRALDRAQPDEGSIWILQDVTAERAARDASESALRDLRASNDALERARTAAVAESATSTQLLAQALLAAEAAEAERRRLGASNETLAAERAGMETRLVSLETRHREAEELRRLAEESHAALQSSHAALIGSHDALKAAHEVLERSHRELRESRRALEDSHEALGVSHEALEQAATERTRELQATNERLEAEIGERRNAESRAQHLADHDALTDLPNRRLLEDRLAQALALNRRKRGHAGVMYLDLDRFKAVNDAHGHAVGDALLREFSARLVSQLRDVDTICRIGGDEFIVVLPELARPSDAAGVAQKLLDRCAEPARIDGIELSTMCSIGISVFPEDGGDAETLIRNADAALYHAKDTGRANYKFFTEQMNAAAERRVMLDRELRTALSEGQLRIQFQSVVDLGDGHVIADEALLRWRHPARGLLEPTEFIATAEETGLIVALGGWALEEACRAAVAAGASRSSAVAVNIAARQFADPKLLERVRRALGASGLEPARLELEVSEAVTMRQPDVSASVLARIASLGVGIVLDNFGASQSSLGFLRRFPLRRLKIDRSVTAALPSSREQRDVISAAVGIGRALGVVVCAVGIETEAQRDALIEIGCAVGQGRLLGRPRDEYAVSQNG